MVQQTVTLIVGIGGTLGGAVVANFLTRSWQHKQWIRDKRLQDYQDVLSATTSAYLAMLRLRTLRGDERLSFMEGEGVIPKHDSGEARELLAAKAESYRVIRDRIFIAKELGYANILVEWDTAVTNFERPGGAPRLFAERFTALNSKLVEMALDPLFNRDGTLRYSRWKLRLARLTQGRFAPFRVKR